MLLDSGAVELGLSFENRIENDPQMGKQRSRGYEPGSERKLTLTPALFS